MKIKKGVIMTGLNPVMRKVMVVTEKLYKKHGKHSVITSALDGVHSPGSAHYFGYALDYRIWNVGKTVAKQIAHMLQTKLGSDYYVLLEHNHIHVQWARHMWHNV